MPTTEFLQLIIVAVVAGYVGYLLGRASARQANAASTAPAPLERSGESEAEAPPRRSSAPPPAGAGGANAGSERTPPRRSSAPPPAAAGLMKRED